MKLLGSLIVCVFVTVVAPAIAQDLPVETADFERWIFQEIDSREMPMSVLQEQIALEIARILSVIDLSDEQIRLLRLAGSGDIKRFYDRMAQVRRQVVAMSQDQKDGGRAHGLTTPLRAELRKGLFGADSLFQKVVATSLNDQQTAALQQHLSRLDKLQTESAARTFVAKIGCHLPLTSVQRTNLTRVLLDNVKSVGNNSPHQFYVVLHRFISIPREQYETFFDENQMQVIVDLKSVGQEIGEHFELEGENDDE